MDYVDSATRSMLGAVKQWWGGETSYFVAKCVNISKTVGYTSKVTICEL